LSLKGSHIYIDNGGVEMQHTNEISNQTLSQGVAANLRSMFFGKANVSNGPDIISYSAADHMMIGNIIKTLIETLDQD